MTDAQSDWVDALFAPVKEEKVADWMKTNFVTVHPGTKIGEIVSLFVERKLNILPVTDKKGRLLGKIRESDVMKLFFHTRDIKHDDVFGTGFDFGYFAKSAEELMRRYHVTLSPDETVGDAARKIVEHELTSVPVVDKDNKLIGIFSAKDLLFGVTRRKRLGVVIGSELLGDVYHSK
ncbi:MAG: CBS domain-containing protein [Candidatus Diapherotrites archaeon]|nr:CBS domain-containing protein [Candidatus Diapherotrites archaeon]